MRPALTVILLCAAAAGIWREPPRPQPLWPGSRYTEADRARAISRGMHFLLGIATDPKTFSDWGADLLWCLYSIGVTSQDPDLRRLAWSRGQERAREWRRRNANLPPAANAEDIVVLVFGSYAADRLGAHDDRMRKLLRAAAPRFPARDYLSFDPTREPPPADVPRPCDQCGAYNPRGRKTCRKCGAPLRMQSPYDVWYDALITTYTGDQYGITLGARYADVFQWIRVLRPYPKDADPLYLAYAISHVVYTLNDYSVYRLSPACLPQEFAFLKENLHQAIDRQDPETLGEFMDSLRAFGLETADPLLRRGVEYLLSTQNADGSWGDTSDEYVYNRYHPTWTAIDGLREYRWRGVRPCP